MTLQEMKAKSYSLIEEYDEEADFLTNDEDLAVKMNFVINQIQNEIARFKKIPAYKKINVIDGQVLNFTDIDKNIYQLKIIQDVDHVLMENMVIFNEDGEAKIFYYKYPKQITNETDDDFKFELTTDVLEIMPYGIAADLLKSDVSNEYGQIYAKRYQDMLSQLDSRYNTGSVIFDGGIDI